MVIDMIKIARFIGVVIDNNEEELIKSRVATRFMCIPGTRPEKRPARIPKNIEIIICSIIF
jgi:hypothetical protein